MEVDDILRAVFGDSDNSDIEDNASLPSSATSYKIVLEDRQKMTWDKIEPVQGLWVCRDFLSSQQQEVLLAAIQAEGWLMEPHHNQVMRFGQLPNWANDLALLIQRAVSVYENQSSTCLLNGKLTDSQITLEESYSRPLPHQIVQREPPFDQMTINSYQPHEGISAHVDLGRFEDGIAIVSLLSTRVMTFTKLDSKKNHPACRESRDQENMLSHVKAEVPMNVPVLLSPGNLLLMSGEARYLWTHEIMGDEKHQFWGGSKIEQRRRISVTLRHLCPASD